MSYAVLHMQKIKQQGIKGMQFHNQRERESQTNQDIDKERSHLNYDLVNPEPIDYSDKINQMIQEQVNTNRAIRKDAVRLSSFLVTSDKSFFDQLDPEQEKEFFEKSLDFFKERYGEEKIAYATVHKDEKTPHMHVGFVPVTEDGRLSAKEFFGKKSQMHQLQDDFHQHVKEHGFDLERGVSSNRKHIEINKYKAMTQAQELEKLESKLEQIKGIESKVENLDKIEVKESRFTDSVKLPLKDYETLRETALDGLRAKQELHDTLEDKKALENEYKAFKEDVGAKQEKQREFVAEVKQENQHIKDNLNDLAQEHAKEIKESLEQETLQEYFDKGYEIGQQEFKKQLQPKWNQLNRDNIELKESNKKLSAQNHELKSDVKQLGQQLETTQEKYREQKQENKELKTENHALKRENSHLQQVVQKLNHQLHHLNKHVDRFKKKIATKVSSWLAINLPNEARHVGDKFDKERHDLVQSTEKSVQKDLINELSSEKELER